MFNPNENSRSSSVRISNNFDKEIVLINDYNDFDIKKVPLYDALVLDFTEKEACKETLRAIRKSNIESIFLLPVFVLSIVDIKDVEVKELSDGVIQTIQPESLNTFIDSIKKKRKQLKPYTVNPEINRHLIKALRFSFTRERTLIPIKDRHSLIGYTYPILSLSLENEQAKSEINAIEEALEKEFFSPEFVDRLHLCGNCYGGFLNYKETDPESGSANLVTESLVHHFSCAYIGPQSDFIRGDQMICPKCNKTLRHIGVDYDKPSVMYRCLDNDNYFQEPEMKAECMNCSHQNEVEGLVQYDVFNLTITDKGIQEAIQPKGSQSSKEIVYNGYITYSTFGTYLRFEIERSKVANDPSCVGLIRLNITSAIEGALGARYDKLIEEVSEFIVTNTDSANILSRSINSFFILFPNSPVEKSKKKLNRISNAINTLLQNNVKDVNIDVVSNIKELTESSEYQGVLNDLRASILTS